MPRKFDDPPGMKPGDRMTAAEFRMVREYLGLTEKWLADHLGANIRTVRRWEFGDRGIPEGVRTAMEELEERTGEVVDAAIAACNDAADPVMVTYRTDEDHQAHHPEQPWPASWHRMVTARVAQEVPGLVVEYWQPPE